MESNFRYFPLVWPLWGGQPRKPSTGWTPDWTSPTVIGIAEASADPGNRKSRRLFVIASPPPSSARSNLYATCHPPPPRLSNATSGQLLSFSRSGSVRLQHSFRLFPPAALRPTPSAPVRNIPLSLDFRVLPVEFPEIGV